MRRLWLFVAIPILCCFVDVILAELPDTSRGDKMIGEYFRVETDKIRDHCLSDISSLKDWSENRGEYRRQLLDMLGYRIGSMSMLVTSTN